MIRSLAKVENNAIVATTLEASYNVFTQSMICRFVSFLDVSPITVKSYSAGIKNFFNFLRNNSISNPDRESVLAFKRELLNSGKKPASIALYLSALRRFFAWTESENLYPDITAGVKAPKIDRGHKKDYFSGAQVKSILASIPRNSLEGLRNYAVFALMATCGLRTIEVVRANIEDLRTLGDCTVLYVQGKGRSDKKEFVKITEHVANAIRTYLKARGKTEDSAPLFVSHSRRNNGQRLTTRTISGSAKNAMISAGFNSSRLTAHSLRHSAVTIALLGGLALSEVQAFARHANIATTQIYAHNVDRIKSTCEAVISNAIFN